MACLHLRMQTGDAAWRLPPLDAPAQEENRLSATRDANGRVPFTGAAVIREGEEEMGSNQIKSEQRWRRGISDRRRSEGTRSGLGEL